MAAIDAVIDELINSGAAEDAKKPVASGPLEVKKPKRAAKNESLEMFPDIDKALDGSKKRSMASLQAAISTFVASQPGDVARFELVATKSHDFTLVRQLKSPSKNHIKLLKRLRGTSDTINLDATKKEDDKTFVVLKHKKAAATKKKVNIKKENVAVADKKVSKKPKKSATAEVSFTEPAHQRISTAVQKLARKKKAAAQQQPVAAMQS